MPGHSITVVIANSQYRSIPPFDSAQGEENFMPSEDEASIRNFYAELFELCGGVQEMRGYPEHRPFLHIISAQACQAVRLESLGVFCVLPVIGMMRLLALAAVRVDELAATGVNKECNSFQLVGVQVLSQSIDVRRDQHAEDVDVLVLYRDGRPAPGFEAVVAKQAGRQVDIPDNHVRQDYVAGVLGPF